MRHGQDGQLYFALGAGSFDPISWGSIHADEPQTKVVLGILELPR